jgi:High-affinity K+ transport system, ATPase chain B
VEIPAKAEFVPFTAQTRMSGLDLADGSQVRKGAASMVAQWIGTVPAPVQKQLDDAVTAISQSGGTPLVVASKDTKGVGTVLGVIHLKDVVKTGLRERFAELRAMGIKT